MSQRSWLVKSSARNDKKNVAKKFEDAVARHSEGTFRLAINWASWGLASLICLWLVYIANESGHELIGGYGYLFTAVMLVVLWLTGRAAHFILAAPKKPKN
jgi:hypothetical protein